MASIAWDEALIASSCESGRIEFSGTTGSTALFRRSGLPKIYPDQQQSSRSFL
jgi:hypothetical protein